MTDARSSWWQTVPGMLTAIAGLITAIGGLVLTLDQAGLIGNDSGSPPPSSASNPPASAGSSSAGDVRAVTPEAAAGPRAPHYSVEFTAGTQAKVRNHRADGIYEIRRATVVNRNTGTLMLTVAVQLTNVGRSDIAFSTEHFRLIVDGAPRAPISSLIDAVDANSAKQAEIVFDLPETAGGIALLIDNGEDSARLPLVLKKQG